MWNVSIYKFDVEIALKLIARYCELILKPTFGPLGLALGADRDFWVCLNEDRVRKVRIQKQKSSPQLKRKKLMKKASHQIPQENGEHGAARGSCS